MAETIEVGVVMGSKSDWDTMKKAVDVLDEFGIGHEVRILSAHRTPAESGEYAATAAPRGLKAIICGAGMAAHLAGAMAAHTVLPILGVPMPGGALNGFDALLSTVQMPKGIPVATFAIGNAGAINAALFAIAMLATSRPALYEKLQAYRREQAEKILKDPDPR
jgi:5-(carboxyamino)imidazole ribonucleotide mutase